MTLRANANTLLRNKCSGGEHESIKILSGPNPFFQRGLTVHSEGTRDDFMGLFPFLIIFLFGFAPSGAVSAPLECAEYLKPGVGSSNSEWNATISSLANRYDRIYPELGISAMDPKLRKLTTRALVAIDLKTEGKELMPDLLLQMRNLLARFKGQPSLEALSASYIGSLARGDLEDAKREAATILGYLQPSEAKDAILMYGVHSMDSAVWETMAKEHSAVFERIKVKDVHGKDHGLFVLLGHPENATSTLQRFHQILRNRYGSELYINDDLVPSALGFYQHVPDGVADDPSYIILRSENLKQDFLDFVGYHEGRHVMFKSARTRMKSIAAVEVQISALGSEDLPVWYEMNLLVPTPENENLRLRHARERNAYKTFMTFEENYNHAKDLQYANRMRHQSVLDLYGTHETLPPNRLFDLELIRNKIDLLDEITFKTKNTALEARLLFEKEVRNLQKEIRSAPETLSILEGLRKEAIELEVAGKYSMKIDFSTPTERELAEELIVTYEKFKHSRNPDAGIDLESRSRVENDFLIVLNRFQEALSERLIESYDFALGIKIRLADLSDRYNLISNKSGITIDEYLDFRREIFNQGRNAKRMLFREGAPEDSSNPPGP